jgi:uncharacterized protein YciI
MHLVNVSIINKDKITETLMNEHVAYVKGCYENNPSFVHIGSLLNSDNGIYIYDLPTEDEVQAIINQDPFYKAGIAEYRISPYLVRHNSIDSIGND